MEQSSTASGMTRRGMMHAAAWSLPVIAVAVATPLAAASGLNVAAVMPAATVDGATFTWPGAEVTNTGTVPATISWSISVAPTLESLSGPLTGTITIPPGGVATVAAGVSGHYVAAAWLTTLYLTLFHDGVWQNFSVSFQAEEV